MIILDTGMPRGNIIRESGALKNLLNRLFMLEFAPCCYIHTHVLLIGLPIYDSLSSFLLSLP